MASLISLHSPDNLYDLAGSLTSFELCPADLSDFGKEQHGITYLGIPKVLCPWNTEGSEPFMVVLSASRDITLFISCADSAACCCLVTQPIGSHITCSISRHTTFSLEVLHYTLQSKCAQHLVLSTYAISLFQTLSRFTIFLMTK